MDITSATLRWQRWLVLATVVGSAWLITPSVWSRDDNFALPKATLVVVVAVAMLWLTVVRWAWWRRVVLYRSPVLVAAGVFAAGMTISTITSTSRLQSVVGQHDQYDGLVLYLACVVLLFATVRTFTPGTVILLLRAFVVALLGVAAYGLLQMAHVDPAPWATSGWVVSFLGNQNFAAGWLSIAVGPCVVLAFMEAELFGWRVAAGVGAVAGLVVIQGTASFQGPIGGGAAVLVATVGVLLVRRPLAHLWTRRNVALALGLVLVVGLGTLGVGWKFIHRSLDEGLYDRKAFWHAAIDVVHDHPIVGTGPDTFHNQFLQRRPKGHAGNNAGAVHDVPLDMLANGGLVTGLPYLAVLALTGFALVQALRRRTTATARLVVVGVAAAWVAYVVQSLVSIDKAPMAVAHWILVGAVVVLAADQGPRVVALPGALEGGRQLRRGAGWLVPAGLATLVALIALVPITRPIRASAAVAKADDEYQHGNFDAAIRDVEHALALAPWEPDNTYFASRIYFGARMGDKAIAAAEKGARLAPGDATYAQFVAQTAGVLGDNALAERWWDITIARDPNYGVYPYEAMRAAATRKDRPSLDKRLAAYKATTDALTGWLTEATMLHLYGDLPGALRASREALALDPTNETIQKQIRSFERELAKKGAATAP